LWEGDDVLVTETRRKVNPRQDRPSRRVAQYPGRTMKLAGALFVGVLLIGCIEPTNDSVPPSPLEREAIAADANLRTAEISVREAKPNERDLSQLPKLLGTEACVPPRPATTRTNGEASTRSTQTLTCFDRRPNPRPRTPSW
jgi:hypothetical protein